MFLSSSPIVQDPPKKKEEPQDTIKRVERPADSLYIQQKAANEKLKELVEEKSKKKL